MKSLIPILSAGSFLLLGCATAVRYQISDGSIPPKRVNIVDQRDDFQKQSKIMSAAVPNCWYGIYRVGDDQLIPDRMDVLAGRISERGGKRADGKQVVVKRFEIYNNIQRDLRALSLSSLSNVAGDALKTRVAEGGCDDGFALDQNPDNRPSVIIHLETEFEGQTFKEKVVQLDPNAEGFNDVKSEHVRKRIRSGVNVAADRIAAQIWK